jgi:hypothetical protein
MSDAGLRKLIIEVIKDAEEWDEYGFKKSTRISKEVIKRAKLRGFDISPYVVIGELTNIWDIDNGRRKSEIHQG